MSTPPPISGNISFTASGIPYNGSFTATPAIAVNPTPPTATPRPKGNTSSGFFVANGCMFDPNGVAFRIRGVNRNHYDSPGSALGIAKALANTTRIFVTQQYGATPAKLASICQSDHVANKQLVIPTVSSAPQGTTYAGTSGSSDPAVLAACVSWIVNNPSAWQPLNNSMVLNIANEWGPANSSAWMSAYVQAITNLRAGGITAPLLIDAGGYGQDDLDVLTYGAELLAADPQSNVLFGVHFYGQCNELSDSVASYTIANGKTIVMLASQAATHPFAPNYNGATNNYSGITAYDIGGTEYAASQNVGGTPGKWTITLNGTYTIPPGASVIDYNGNYVLRIERLAGLQAKGVCVVISEFGPGQNVGPSPTLVTPQQIINACESAGLGWMPWAWDDNNLAGGQTSPTGWFGMTLNGPGDYATAADLTPYGAAMVPFWAQLAKYHT